MYAATSWGYRHSRFCTGVRIAAGTWNLVIGIILLAHGYWGGAVLFATAALIFAAAYLLARGKSGSLRRGQQAR